MEKDGDRALAQVADLLELVLDILVLLVEVLFDLLRFFLFFLYFHVAHFFLKRLALNAGFFASGLLLGLCAFKYLREKVVDLGLFFILLLLILFVFAEDVQLGGLLLEGGHRATGGLQGLTLFLFPSVCGNDNIILRER